MKRTIYVNAYNKAPRIGDSVMVHSYKYSGWLYRSWSFPVIIDENEEFIVLAVENATVLSSEEDSKRIFSSIVSKPTFWFFFKDKWFNMIVTVENYGVKTYINIASPFMYEEGAIKYIDFDLDFKTNASHKWKEMDINEYFQNQIKFKYPEKIIKSVNKTELYVKEKIKENWFDKFANLSYLTDLYKKYLEILEKRENG